MNTLYRKYRPLKFEEIVGQDHIVAVLKNALKQSRVAHGYLFTGPRGTGKTTTARILARELNCNGLDLIEVDAASNRGIDEIRALRDSARISTGENSWRVFILDEAHMLTSVASNALLKSLEEPPPRTVFILITTEQDKIMSTIKSRLQILPFKSISLSDIILRLEQIIKKEKVKVDSKVIKAIAINASGGMRDAESNLTKILNIEKQVILIEDVRNILGIIDEHLVIKYIEMLFEGDKSKIFIFIKNLEDKGIQEKIFLKSFLEYWRKLILISVNPQIEKELSLQLTKEDLAIIIKQAKKASSQVLIKTAQIFLQNFNDSEKYPEQMMALEIATLQCLDLFKKTK